MSETIEYYEKNAQDFAASTADIEFSELQDTFLAELKKGASVLDFGCGSGRDTCYFLKKGYLHLSRQELKQVLVHMEQALHKGGIIYRPGLGSGSMRQINGGICYGDYTGRSRFN